MYLLNEQHFFVVEERKAARHQNIDEGFSEVDTVST